jgi:hypothetical protein
MRVFRLLLPLAILSLAALMVSVAHAAVIGKAVVTADQAPIMKGKETVATAKKGDVLDVTQENGDWFGVAPTQGWIHKSNVRYEPAAPAGAPKAESVVAANAGRVAQRASRPALSPDGFMRRREGLPSDASKKLGEVVTIDATQAPIVLVRQEEFWDDRDAFDKTAFEEFLVCVRLPRPGRVKPSFGSGGHNLRDCFTDNWPWANVLSAAKGDKAAAPAPVQKAQGPVVAAPGATSAGKTPAYSDVRANIAKYIGQNVAWRGHEVNNTSIGFLNGRPAGIEKTIHTFLYLGDDAGGGWNPFVFSNPGGDENTRRTPAALKASSTPRDKGVRLIRGTVKGPSAFTDDHGNTMSIPELENVTVDVPN